MANLITWLKERTALNMLSEETLVKIEPYLQLRSYPANHTLLKANTQAEGIYILYSGCLQKNGTQLLTGTVLNIQELILKQPVSDNIATCQECECYFISAEEFNLLLQECPEIIQIFSQTLKEKLEKLNAELIFEQDRQTILRPYLIPKIKRGIIGKSRYAIRLRKQIKQASEDENKSVIIFGEPGLEKDNIASLIHFSSAQSRQPIAKINCDNLQVSGADLFGRVGGKMGLIEAVGTGTLVLNNIQDLPVELYPAITQLITDNIFFPVNKSAENRPIQKENKAKIILISEKVIKPIDEVVNISIKVPPLRVRKSDIGDYLNYYINLICRKRKILKPRINDEALRKLQSYDFPNNLRELESLIARALTQLEGCTEITEEILWASQSKKQQFRVNLLNKYPNLRKFLRSSWYPDKINYGIISVVFALVVAILFFAPQHRSENFALNLFWAWWWPFFLLLFPFLGRIWCAFCPFMIYGEITQKISLWLFPRQLKKWPRQSAEKWGGWFLFALFALILLWEELWNLPDTAYLSACLLLLITAGAMIFSAIFERRFWCRYLCPIGGMNGMFAKLSMTELRAVQGTCSAECTTYQCYKGGARKGEGLETNGCPLYSHPAQLQDNRDCVLCMTCLKACPHRSVRFNLRPPAIELWTIHQPRSYEVALLFLLLNLVFLHCLPQLNNFTQLNVNLDAFSAHFVLSLLVLIIPTLLPWLAYKFSQFLLSKLSTFKPRSFVELAYGYLPLVLAGNLAYYLHLGLGEAGKIIPVTWATFGFSTDNLPIFVAHPAVISFLQGVTLIIGAIGAIVITQKISKQPLKFLLPQHLSIISLSWIFAQLIIV